MRNPGRISEDAAAIDEPSIEKTHAHAKPWAWHPAFRLCYA
jgi:hypothetical protein